MPRFDDQRPRVAHGGGFGQGHDSRPRGHHFADAGIAEFNRRLDQFALFLFEDSFGLADIDQGFDIILVMRRPLHHRRYLLSLPAFATDRMSDARVRPQTPGRL